MNNSSFTQRGNLSKENEVSPAFILDYYQATYVQGVKICFSSLFISSNLESLIEGVGPVSSK